jgi:hypothetical protein
MIQNLLFRSIIIWTVVFLAATVIPAQIVFVENKLLIATLVTILYVLTEVVFVQTRVENHFCKAVCGPSITFNTEADKYIMDALNQLNLQEKSGPAAKPTVPVPSVALAAPPLAVAPKTTAPTLAPITTPPVLPSAVPTAAAALPPAPVVSVSTPAISTSA